jgi:FkbM family methyltransferase
MNLFRFLKKCRKAVDVIFFNAKASYSQMGEDLIIGYLFDSLKINKPTYLEIGTNQPKSCNNTYALYLKGCTGVCIEPDFEMFQKIKKVRKKDTVLNIGIGTSSQNEADFYLFPYTWNGWSTFSLEEAEIRKKETGIHYEIKKVPLVQANDIIKNHFTSHPNFISLDVEGLDLEILKSIDFGTYKTEVICVETITFGYLNNTEKKMSDITNYMKTIGYEAYADTHINTIYCRKDLFTFLND